MAIGWIELVTGSLEQKRRYRQYKARIRELPANYRVAAEALERYLIFAGGIAKGDVVVRMQSDLVDLFETSAANGTPIRDIFGDDPIEFVEAFIANYSDGAWINKERKRFADAIDSVAAGDTGKREGTAR